jgi:predicted phosphodiesterase
VKKALISDIHGNLEALSAVFEDIRSRGVTEICCLGDIVGYGSNPCECLDLVIDHCRVSVLGNHDQAVLFDPDGFNPVALQAVFWTRDQLESNGDSSSSNRRWDFLGELPRSYSEGDLLLVHGSPREPTNEYVFPEDVYNQRKMDALFDRIERYCFQGHTHIPGVFTASGEFISPDECQHQYRLTEEKAMFNVGSVGQPRDSDPRACYAILDTTDQPMVEFCRVEYPIEIALKKIYDIPNLDNMLGDRLRNGR